MFEIVPVIDEGLRNSSYPVGLGDGRALVVDPSRDPSPYLAAAEGRGWELASSAETMTGAGLLARRGRDGLAVLDGGPEDRSRASGRPLEAEA